MLWTVICTVPGLPWNAARITSSFALAGGHAIYSLRDSGAQLGWFYGPMFPLWYWPVTLTDSPTGALVLAAIGNMVTVVAPILLILRQAGVARRPAALFAAAVVSAVFLLGSATFRWIFYFVHVDAVCIAWGLVGCAALHHGVRNAEKWALHVAALAVAAAFWTKLLAGMLVPGMLLWLWASGQRRIAGSFAILCAVYLTATTAVIFAGFGGDKIIFNMILVHAGNPFQLGFDQLKKLVGMIAGGMWIWIPAMACLFSRRASSRARRRVPVEASSMVSLLLWSALAQLPLGLIACLKAGGGLNSVHAFMYLLAAGLVVMMHETTQPIYRGEKIRLASFAWSFALLVPVLSGLWLLRTTDAAWRVHRGLEGQLAMVRAQPGRYYLPWNPLVTLMGENRVYPFDDALYCLWLSGLEVPIDKVRAAVPSNPIIVYDEPAQSKFALRYFPELTKKE